MLLLQEDDKALRKAELKAEYDSKTDSADVSDGNDEESKFILQELMRWSGYSLGIRRNNVCCVGYLLLLLSWTKLPFL